MKKTFITITLLSFFSSFSQVKYNGSFLGVGTTSPSSTLNIHGSTPNLEISNISETDAGILFYDHGFESSQSAKILFGSSGSNRLKFVFKDRDLITLSGNSSVSLATFHEGNVSLSWNYSTSSGYLAPTNFNTNFDIGTSSSNAINRVYTRYVYRNYEYSLSDESTKKM